MDTLANTCPKTIACHVVHLPISFSPPHNLTAQHFPGTPTKEGDAMFKRFLVIACMGCAAMLSPVWLSAQTATQDQSYFTYVSQWAVPRAEWANFEKQEKDDDALMQKLVADGTIIAYGDSTSRVHTEDGYTHADWMTATSRANLLKALEETFKTASNAAFVGTTKHYYLILRTLAHGGKPASGATGYLRVVFWQARPGAEDALEAH